METVTIDGMSEDDFRYGVEDMLRLGLVDEASERLRLLVEPYAGSMGILPPRFREVTAANLEISGWDRLAERLHNHDRAGRPISAIGIVLADARVLGGPGPERGRLAPFIKTYYFTDDAYPFSDATREDLLDGYTREGFGWQSDYQATDAGIAIKGVDDLHGAIVELEDRLLDSATPPGDYIAAGTVGACYLAALIHQALRDKIRECGLPRPLCVLAACDGVYPFFDAPVAGLDECEAVEAAAPAAEDDVWPNELEAALPAEGMPAVEGSLLGLLAPRAAKQAVIVLGDGDMEEAALFNERALAQTLELPVDQVEHALLQTHAPGRTRERPAGLQDVVGELRGDGAGSAWHGPQDQQDEVANGAPFGPTVPLAEPLDAGLPEPGFASLVEQPDTGMEFSAFAEPLAESDCAEPQLDVAGQEPGVFELARPVAAELPVALTGHELRSRITLGPVDTRRNLGERSWVLWDRLRRALMQRWTAWRSRRSPDANAP